MTVTSLSGLEIRGAITPAFAEILTPEACAFVAGIFREFEPRRQELLRARVARQAEIDAGKLPDFLEATRAVREGSWRVASIPADLLDRRTEITGPVDRKMVINALNSGAKVFMADFEDATSPTWNNLIEGHINLRDAVRRSIGFTSPEGKAYMLNEKTATLLVRPRGWHLPEKHVLLEGNPVSGSLFDFGLYFFHNARELLARGSGPYFYLPKMEGHLEARLWNDVFVRAQEKLGIPRGSVRATALIETILGAFEAEEILYELREHSCGLNCGRWDYIFSCIKKLKERPDYLFPDRTQVTMTAPFMRAYCLYVIKVCHRRGAHAMGGMAAQIPIKNNPAANEEALAKVLADKEREAADGHDGTWVAHPGLVPVALKAFDKHMPGPNQISRQREDVTVTAADLLAAPSGTITDAGIRTNISVGIQYLEAWFGGLGCVPLYNLMEDAATAEISRTQIWQWLHRGAKLEDGHPVTPEHYDMLLGEVITKIRSEVGAERYANGHFRVAAHLFTEMVKAPRLDDFLTLPAYELLGVGPAMPISLEALNATDAASFTDVLGHLFEHSPWVAEHTYAKRPFANLTVLHAALCETMLGAPKERQLELLRAHPDLAGRLSQAGQLTRASAREQSTAGLDRLSAEEAAEVTRLNEAYRKRFGFPFIICARLNAKDSILSAMRTRLGKPEPAELSTALAEVAKIARLRLNEAVT